MKIAATIFIISLLFFFAITSPSCSKGGSSPDTTFIKFSYPGSTNGPDCTLLVRYYNGGSRRETLAVQIVTKLVLLDSGSTYQQSSTSKK